MIKKTIAIVASSALLSACGGGGGGSESSNNAPVNELTGTFVDSPVSGLHYETASRSGLTNEEGEFKYLAGETVTFSIGNTLLGSAPGDDVITPFNLLGINVPEAQTQILNALSAQQVNSLDRVINIATLLQALDSDGNPDNGIDLGNAHATLGTTEINLIAKAIDFVDSSSLATARDQLGVDHQIVLTNVVNHLYDNMNVQVRSNLVASYRAIDDKTPLETVYYSYDNDGRVVETRFDRGSDGSIENTRSTRYDSNGNVSRISNTAPASTQLFSYDGNDNLVLARTQNGSGNNSSQTYTYNSDNKLILLELDSDDDGTPDSITSYQYDASGNLVVIEQDKDGNGSVDATQRFTYAAGLVQTFRNDTNNDGVDELSINYTYDANGNKVLVTTDRTADGVADSTARFQYDDRNNPVRYELDNNMDNSADYIEVSRFNTQNKRSYLYRDTDGDGAWDRISQFFYDLDGNQIRMIEDRDGNGIADKVWTGNYEPAIFSNSWDIIIGQLEATN